MNIEMKQMSCGKCGIHFSIPLDKYNRCANDGEAFVCPNGHSRVFIETTASRLGAKINRLEKELAATIERRLYWTNEYNTLLKTCRALRGHNTRLRNKLQQKYT